LPQILAALGAKLFELPVDLHHVGMLFGVLQQQFGALDAQFNLLFVEAGKVFIRFDRRFGRRAVGFNEHR
jgi:hypothetical protein